MLVHTTTPAMPICDSLQIKHDMIHCTSLPFFPVQLISSIPPGQFEAKSQKKLFGKHPRNGESSPPLGHIEGTEPSSHTKVALAAGKDTKLFMHRFRIIIVHMHTVTRWFLCQVS